MHLLVNFSRESVQNRLVAGLYKEEMFDNLLHEDDTLTAERNRVKQLLEAYKQAFAGMLPCLPHHQSESSTDIRSWPFAITVLSEVTFKPTA